MLLIVLTFFHTKNVENAIVPLGARDFWCGSDVYKIQAKCVSGESTVACWPA